MAPVLRLANELAICADKRHSPADLCVTLKQYRTSILRGPQQLSKTLRLLLQKLDKPEIYTYSYSSTIVAALRRTKHLIWGVHCSESRPGNEGKKTAMMLGRSGIRVVFDTDADLMSQLHKSAVVLLGVDAVMPGFVAGKTGTRALARLALRLGTPLVWVCDTTKFIPNGVPWKWTWGPDEEIWEKPPRNVSVYNLYVELTQFSKRMRFLTERGWMSPLQVRREANEIPVSPWLKEVLRRKE